MSTLNSNTAARLPFLKPLNTPQTSTAAGHSAANAQIANAALGDHRSEFSRLLVRSQTAAAVSQRPSLPAGKAPPPHRPVSPAPTSRADAAASSSADDPAAESDSADAATAVADEAGAAAASSRAHPSARAAAAHAKSAAASADAEPAAAVSTDPAAVDATRPNDPGSAPQVAPTAAELASLAAWGALPMPPAAAPTTPASEGAGEASADAELTTDAQPSSDATDLALLPDRGAATHSPNGKAEPAVDAGLDAATANGQASDTALANLELLSTGVRPDSDHSLRHGTELATPPAWAIGASAASAQVRAVHPAAPPPAAASIATPLTDSGFHEALGMQVSLLAREGIHQAELRLNPADMGPVSVQITMNGDQARVDFGADLAQTRQVIEAGWAELAASLQEAGFTLSGGGVSEHARNRQEPVVSSSRGVDRSGATEDAPVVAVVAARPRAGAALDLYA